MTFEKNIECQCVFFIPFWVNKNENKSKDKCVFLDDAKSKSPYDLLPQCEQGMM